MKISMLTRNAMIASLYLVLTLVPPLNSLAYGSIQFRVSEALLILVFFKKEYLFGIILGTFFANFFGPLGGGFAILDAVFGSLVTFFAGLWMDRMRSIWPAILGPILLNGIYLGVFLPFALNLPITFLVMLATGSSVAFGEAVVLVVLGLPFYSIIIRSPTIQRIFEVDFDE